MRTLNTLIAGLAMTLGVLAQDSGEIQGRAFQPDGQAAGFANVSARQGDRLVGAQADIDGRYTLKPLPPGGWTVEISFVGLASLVIQAVQVEPGRISFIPDQRLAYSDSLKPTEIVRWTVPLVRKDDPTRMTLLDSDIKHNPTVKNTKDLVAKSFPGVYKGPNGDGLYFRGSRSENMASYIDGVRVPGTVPSIPASAISSISVYTGGLPARYGDVTGGVVVIETKTYFEMYEERRALEEAAAQRTQ
jgi:hypothetical protein